MRLEVCKDPSRYVWDPATCDSRIAVQYASKLLTGPPNHYKQTLGIFLHSPYAIGYVKSWVKFNNPKFMVVLY